MNKQFIFPGIFVSGNIRIKNTRIGIYLLLQLVLFSLILIFTILYLNINKIDTIWYSGNIKLNVKHPIAYHITNNYYTNKDKEYIIVNGWNPWDSINISTISNPTYPVKDIISKYSKGADEVIIDSKSDSYACIIKHKYKDIGSFRLVNVSFIKIIKTKDFYIKIATSKGLYIETDVFVFGKYYRPVFFSEKSNFDKKIEIIKSIQIIDGGKNDL